MLVPEEKALFERIREIVAQTLRISPEEISLESVLTEDLGAESIDFVDIVFRQEQEFKVKFFPGSAFDKIEELFDPDALSRNRLLTEQGAEVLRERMPEVDAAKIYTGMPVAEISRLFTTRTWVRTVKELLEARPTECPQCGSDRLEVIRPTSMVCEACDEELTCPTHEEVLEAWAKRRKESPADVPE